MEVFNLATGLRVWSFDVLELEHAMIGPAFFTPDGRHVVVGVMWHPIAGAGNIDPPTDLLGLHVMDARNGSPVTRLDLGHCGGFARGVTDTRALVDVLAIEDGPCAASPPDNVQLEWLDLDSGARHFIAVGFRGPASTWSTDGRVVAYDDFGIPRSIVVNLENSFECHVSPQPEQYVWALNRDGSLLLHGDDPVTVWDVNRCAAVQEFDGHAGPASWAEFGPDGQTVYSAGRDGRIIRWDARSGRVIDTAAGLGNGQIVPVDAGRLLVAGVNTETAVLVDVRPTGELGAFDVRAIGDYWQTDGEAEDCVVLAGGLLLSGDTALVTESCNGARAEATTTALNTDTLIPRYSLRGTGGRQIAVSPDGRHFVRQEQTGNLAGPLWVRDLHTGEQVVELDGLCTYDNSHHTPVANAVHCAAWPESPFAFRYGSSNGLPTAH
jgi:WD40 repeat protein